MSRYSICLIGLGVSALSLSISSALAQTASSNNTDEMVITGHYLYSDKINSLKSPTPVLDVPQSLSIISADQITLQGFSSVGDIINYTPGVNSSQGEGHRDAIVFRGVRSTADFYIDGVRDDVQYYRPLYNLEQVEILRGPNALLFGRGGTGGILNRVTKKAINGEDFTGFQLGTDSFGELNGQVDSNISINDRTTLRVNAFYEDLENHRDFFDGDRLGVNPTLNIILSAATTLDLSYEYVDHERFIDRGIPTGANGRPVEAFDEIIFGDPDINKTQLEAHLFRAILQHEFSSALKTNISAFYGDFDKLYQNFYASAYDQATTPDQVTLDGYIDTTDRQNTILSGNLVGQFATGTINHTLIAGTEYIDTSSDQDRFNSFWDTTADDNEVFSINRPLNLTGGVGENASGLTTTNSFTTDLNDDTRVNIEVYSVYLQDEIEVSRNLDLVLGARFDSFDIDVFNVPADDQRSRRDEEISPRAGLVYKPQENVSLYLSYSESFLPRSGEQFANINGDNDQLDPDVFESREAGLKWVFNNNLSLTAAYFENEQTRADRDNVTGEAFEVRGLEIDGFEFQIEGRLSDRLTVRAGYSNLDGETANGDQPRELPEQMASLWSSYQATEKLGFGFGVTYQDESLISDGGSAVLPSYTRVDAAAYYQLNQRFKIQLNIENLNDEDYFPNSHSTHQVTVGAPFNARLSLNGQF